MDTLTKAERSKRMALIRGKDTKPEIIVRRIVRRLGIHFVCNRKDLPGCPDLVFTRRRKVIFVHGCFWHLHKPCHQYRLPQSRLDFWLPKLQENTRRDRRNRRTLKKLGWLYFVVWECGLKDQEKLKGRLKNFLR